MRYTADFETTTDENDCRVWSYGICNIDNTDEVHLGNNLDDFMEFLFSGLTSHTVYFHNLKFDSQFIMHWLFSHGYKHMDNVKTTKLDMGEFSSLISTNNNYYALTVCFGTNARGNKKHTITFWDSLKLLPFTVKEVALSFNLPIKKGSINYKKKRELGYIPTQKENDYQINDVRIMAMALASLFKQDLNKMTTSGNALSEYKKIIGEKTFKKWFPFPDYDKVLRPAYVGGFTYCKEDKKGKDVGEGLVFDVNSLYPSVMRNNVFPWGEGMAFIGKYKETAFYPLYIQRFEASFKVREGYLPTIQIKGHAKFRSTEYVTDTKDELVTLSLTNVSLALFFEHYEIFELKYIDGYMWKSKSGMFTEYVDKWSAVKIQAKKDKNAGMYTLSKLMLNSLYGKFGTSTVATSKIPTYIKESKEIIYPTGEPRVKKGIYLPVAAFITSYARDKTIRAAQKLYDRFLYSDTDSLHITGTEIPYDVIDVSDTDLGAWKHESTFKKARFLRAKSYIELSEIDFSEYTKMKKYNKENGYVHHVYHRGNKYFFLNIACAGMPAICHKQVTWGNFNIGQAYSGKLKQKRVSGGVVLIETEFTIKKHLFGSS